MTVLHSKCLGNIPIKELRIAEVSTSTTNTRHILPVPVSRLKCLSYLEKISDQHQETLDVRQLSVRYSVINNPGEGPEANWIAQTYDTYNDAVMLIKDSCDHDQSTGYDSDLPGFISDQLVQ